MSARVSPTDRIRAEIDALFDGSRELGEVIEDVARLGARLIIQTAVEAEVEVFLGRARYQRGRRRAGRPAGQPQRLLRGDDQDHGRAGHRGAAEAAGHHRGVRVAAVRHVGDQVECVGVAGDRRVRARACRCAMWRTPWPTRSAPRRRCRSRRSRGSARRSATSSTAWSARRLDDLELDYLFLDASMFKMHPGARAEPVLAAWGITTDGKPVFVALAAGGSESTDAWGELPRRAARPGAAPAAAGHLRRRRRADQRHRVVAAPRRCANNA